MDAPAGATVIADRPINFCTLSTRTMRATTALRTLMRHTATVARCSTHAVARSHHRLPAPMPSSLACFSSAAAAAPSSSSDAAASATPVVSFIGHAKLYGAASLIGPFPTGGRFDSCLSGLVITRMDPSGEVDASMIVNQQVENSYGSLHGGAISTIVDVVGTLALLAKDHKRGGVSVSGRRQRGRQRARQPARALALFEPHSFHLRAVACVSLSCQIELNVNFLAAIKVGSRVVCKGRVLKLGKTLGFTQVELFTEDGTIGARQDSTCISSTTRPEVFAGAHCRCVV
jgi:acyl-coenzyme A thioesterase 13